MYVLMVITFGRVFLGIEKILGIIMISDYPFLSVKRNYMVKADKFFFAKIGSAANHRLGSECILVPAKMLPLRIPAKSIRIPGRSRSVFQ